MKYSIATLLLVMLLVAVTAFTWKQSRPLEHFEIVVSGDVAKKLEPGTLLGISSRLRSGTKPVVCDLEDLPLRLEKEEYLGKSWYVTFFGPGQSRALFNVALSDDLFDVPRRINIKLDKPKPVIHPFATTGLEFRYSANISQRMAYDDLPFWNKELGRLTPCPSRPRFTVTNENTGKRIQDSEMTTGCMGSKWFSRLRPDAAVNDGDQLVLFADYDSGDLFDDTSVKYVLEYRASLHH